MWYNFFRNVLEMFTMHTKAAFIWSKYSKSECCEKLLQFNIPVFYFSIFKYLMFIPTVAKPIYNVLTI